MRSAGIVGSALAAAVLWSCLGVPAGAVTAGSGSTASIGAHRAHDALVDVQGRPLDGTGVSIAIIDTGVDATHPSFRLPDGGTKVVRTLTTLSCAAHAQVGEDPACVTDLSVGGDSDSPHGGHGTFAAAVAVGNPFTLADGTTVGGVAPGARLVMLSSTTALVAVQNAFAWILEHHAAPCGAGVPADVCPPIRAVSCSWGAADEEVVEIERALADAGVVTIWAAGNAGTSGSDDDAGTVSSPIEEVDHGDTPGVLRVANYDDLGTGTRNGRIAPNSTRGVEDDPDTWPDLAAPGVNIVSACRAYLAICQAIGTQPRDGPGPTDVATFFTASGSSWAAPAVAGVVALLVQADPTTSAARIDDVLKRSAHRFAEGEPYRDVGGHLTSLDKGAGLVDAFRAALWMGARRTHERPCTRWGCGPRS